MTEVSHGSFLHSLRWAFLMTWARRLMTTIVTVLLAAILGPKDFGVVAIATIFIAILTVLTEQGLVTAIVQRESLEPEHVDAAFWMNLAWCLLLAGVSVALSGVWAELNGVPEVQPLVAVLSISVVLRGVIQPQIGLLQRKLDFKLLGLRTNLATFAGGAIGIGLALGGAGAWALVAQVLVFDAVSAVTLYAVSDWRPRIRFSRRHAGDLLGFSVSVFFSDLAAFLYRRSDALFLGMFCGPQVVGIYRLCDRLVVSVLEITMQPIGAASLPYFSRLQNDAAELQRAVAWTIRLALRIAIPVLLAFAACSPWLLGVLGGQWTPGTTALKLLCVAGIVKSMINFVGPLLFAVDRPRIRAGTMWLLAAIGVGTMMVVGLWVGDESESTQLLGVSLSRAAVFMAIVAPLNLLVVRHVTGFSPLRLVRWLPRPIGAGLAAVAVGALLQSSGWLDGVTPFLALVVAGSLVATVTIVSVLVLDGETRRWVTGFLPGRVRQRFAPPRSTPAARIEPDGASHPG